MEGFEKIGFSGGGGGSNPACERYGYGFVQGVEAGAAEKGTKVEMRYSWEDARLHIHCFSGFTGHAQRMVGTKQAQK